MVVDKVEILENDDRNDLERTIKELFRVYSGKYELIDIKFSVYFRYSQEYYCVLLMWKLIANVEHR